MKALFLVGGSGTRLRPFTNYLPKPMIPIMGRPLLERTCERLLSCGIDEVVMNPCYMPHVITEHFGDGKQYGLSVHYEMEEAPLGTGGAIKNTQQHYDDSFFVFNADILHDVPLEEMMAYHKQMGADVTISATYVEDPTPYGTIHYTRDGYITEFKEKPKPEEVSSHYINAGIYIFEPHVLDYIPAGRPVSVEREVFPALLKAGRPMAMYRCGGYWMDIGTPQKYVQAHRDIFAGVCEVEEPYLTLSEACVDDSAQVEDSALLECDSFVGRKARVDAYCIIGSQSVVGDKAHIGRGCHLEDVIVWPGTHVPAHHAFQHCVLAQRGSRLLYFPHRSSTLLTKGKYVQ